MYFRLYRKEKQGTRFEKLTVKSPDGSPVLGFCKLSHGTVWPAFYTENNIYTIQVNIYFMCMYLLLSISVVKYEVCGSKIQVSSHLPYLGSLTQLLFPIK